MHGRYVLIMSLSVNLFDTRQSTIHTHNLCLKAEIKGYPRVLQTANDGRKGQVSHSSKFLVCLIYYIAPRVHFVSSEGQIVHDIIISGTSLIQKDAACKHQGPCAYTEGATQCACWYYNLPVLNMLGMRSISNRNTKN